MSARGELEAPKADVSFVDEDGSLALWFDDVEITGTRDELEEFIAAQVEELGGVTDPGPICKQGVDGHGTVPEPRTMRNLMDWASYQVTSYKGEPEAQSLSRSVWVCDKPSCVADAASWALRGDGATSLTIKHQPTNAEGTLVTLDSVLGVRTS